MFYESGRCGSCNLVYMADFDTAGIVFILFSQLVVNITYDLNLHKLSVRLTVLY